VGWDVIVNNYVKGAMVLDIVDVLLDVQSAKTVDKMVHESLEHFPSKTSAARLEQTR
jgi:hypothetical protein